MIEQITIKLKNKRRPYFYDSNHRVKNRKRNPVDKAFASLIKTLALA